MEQDAFGATQTWVWSLHWRTVFGPLWATGFWFIATAEFDTGETKSMGAAIVFERATAYEGAEFRLIPRQ